MSIYNYPPGGGPSPPPGPTCLKCYDAGCTPETVFFCLAGIKIGAAWAAPKPPPPNGIGTLGISINCKWDVVQDGWSYNYQILRRTTTFTCRIAAGDIAFQYSAAPTCQLWQSNTVVDPAGVYYDGWAMVVPQIAGGSWSLPELMELFSDDPFWAPWINPRPDSGNQTFYNIYQPQDATRVKVLIDHS